MCASVRAPLVPRHSLLGCAVWACLLGLRLWPGPATPNKGVRCGCVCLGSGCGWAPPFLAGVLRCSCLCARSACTPPLLAGVCVLGLEFRLSPATPGWAVGVCVFVCALRLYPATPGWVSRCGWVRSGSVFGCAPSLLAAVLGCVCVCVRTPLLPRHSWLGCAVWVGVLGLGFQLHPATHGWGVGVLCVLVCTLPLVPRHSWLGCAVWACVLGLGWWPGPATPNRGVRCGCVCLGSGFGLRPATPGWGVGVLCVLVCALRLYPATPGWGVWSGRVCLGWGSGWAPPLLAWVLGFACLCARSGCTPPLLAGVCVLGLGFRLRPATPGWAVAVCVFVCALRLYPATPGCSVRCAWVCSGSGLGWGVGVCVCICVRPACIPPLLAGVCGVGVCAWARVSAAPRHSWLGCWGSVCACVRAPLVPRHSWLQCAVWACVLGPGLWLGPASRGWGVGVCVFVCAIRLYPATPGWDVRCGCVCLGSGFGCAPPLLAGVSGCVCACVPAPLVPRHSWLGFVVRGFDVTWHLFRCRGLLRVVLAARVCGTRWPLLLGTFPCALVVASGVPLLCAWWPRVCTAPRPVRSLSMLRWAFPTPWCLSPTRGLAPPALLGGCAGHAEAGRETGSLCLPLAPGAAGALGSLRVVPVRGPAMGLSLAGPFGFGLGLRALRWFACVDPVTDASGFPYRPSFDGGLGRCTGAVSCGHRHLPLRVGGRNARVPCVCACARPSWPGRAGRPSGRVLVRLTFFSGRFVFLLCSAPCGLGLPLLWFFGCLSPPPFFFFPLFRLPHAPFVPLFLWFPALGALGLGAFVFFPPPPPACIFFVMRPLCLWFSLVSGPGCPAPWRCVLFVLLGSRSSALRGLSPLLLFPPGNWLLPGGCPPPLFFLPAVPISVRPLCLFLSVVSAPGALRLGALFFFPPPPPGLCFFLSCAPFVSRFLWFRAPGALGLGAVCCLFCWPPAPWLSVLSRLFCGSRLVVGCSLVVASPPLPLFLSSYCSIFRAPPLSLSFFGFRPRVPCALAPCFSFLLTPRLVFFCIVLRPRYLWLSLVSGPGCPRPWRCVLFVLLASRSSALRALSSLLWFPPGRWLLPGGRPPTPHFCVSLVFSLPLCAPFFFLVACPRCLRLSLVCGPGCPGPWRCVLFVLLASRSSALRALSPPCASWLAVGCSLVVAATRPPPFVSRCFSRCRLVLCFFFSLRAPVVSRFLWFPAPGALGLGAVCCLFCWPPAPRLSVRSRLLCGSRLDVGCSLVVAAPPPPPPFVSRGFSCCRFVLRFLVFFCAPPLSLAFSGFRPRVPWALALCAVCFDGLPLLGSPCALASFVFPAWPYAAWWYLLPPPPFVSRGFCCCCSVLCFFSPLVGGSRRLLPPPTLVCAWCLVLSGVAAPRCPSVLRAVLCCLALRWCGLLRAVRCLLGCLFLCCAALLVAAACSAVSLIVPSGWVVRRVACCLVLACVVACSAVLCVSGCGAAPRCCASCLLVLCCRVLCCFVALVWCCCLLCPVLWRCPSPWGPVLCGAVFCGVPPRCELCAVCVLSWRADAGCCSPLCCVLCVLPGVALCVPCPLRSVRRCLPLCWCACFLLSVWCVLLLANGAVVRCCVLCCFLWCSVVRCWVWRPVGVCWPCASVSVSLSGRVVWLPVGGVVCCGALLPCVVFCRAVLSRGAVLLCSAVVLRCCLCLLCPPVACRAVLCCAVGCLCCFVPVGGVCVLWCPVPPCRHAQKN